MAAPFEYDTKRAIKQAGFSPCIRCGKGVMHAGVPVFHRITLEIMGIDARAAQRQAGLEMMLGGNAMIAHAMGPDDDIGIPIGPAQTALICSDCFNDSSASLPEIMEAMNEREHAAVKAGKPEID